MQDQIRISESYGLRLPFENIMQFIKKLNKPIIIAGLGANCFSGFDANFHKKLSSDLVNFLKFLSNHCIQIGVRGHFSEEVLHNLGIKNVNAIGCPSFYEQGRDRVINKKQLITTDKILRTSCFGNDSLRDNYQIMQDLCEEKFIKAVAFNKFEANFENHEIARMLNKKYRIFANMDEWKHFVSQFTFAIGYRVHGAIVCLNSGVPAMCLNGDSRAKEMCELMKIPYKTDVDENTDLIELYEELDLSELNSCYPALYDNFEKFLSNNGVSLPAKHNGDCNEIFQPTLELYNKSFHIEITKELNKNIENLQVRQSELETRLVELTKRNKNIENEIRCIGKIKEFVHKHFRLLEKIIKTTIK